MIDYLVHIHKIGTKPFQNLSSLTDSEALQIMGEQYVEGSIFWERFEHPKKYWEARKQVERWLYEEFIAKGGKPKETYPIYMVAGRPQWAERRMDALTKSLTQEIRVPFSLFGEADVSFSYPDSMVSWFLEQEKNPEHYQPGYHGKVFTRSEIISLVSEKGFPEDGWTTNVPDHFAHYIEAQVWNREPLLAYMDQLQKKASSQKERS